MRYIQDTMIIKDSMLEEGQPFGDGLRLHEKLDREMERLLREIEQRKKAGG